MCYFRETVHMAMFIQSFKTSVSIKHGDFITMINIECDTLRLSYFTSLITVENSRTITTIRTAIMLLIYYAHAQEFGTHHKLLLKTCTTFWHHKFDASLCKFLLGARNLHSIELRSIWCKLLLLLPKYLRKKAWHTPEKLLQDSGRPTSFWYQIRERMKPIQ